MANLFEHTETVLKSGECYIDYTVFDCAHTYTSVEDVDLRLILQNSKNNYKLAMGLISIDVS